MTPDPDHRPLAGLFAADELEGLRSIAYVVLDSLRWDSFERAATPTLDRLAPRQERRRPYASWTMPSHTCLLAGLLPYRDEGRPAAEVYLADQLLWAQALVGDPAAIRRLVPEFCLADLARRCGWRTTGRVSMPVLNPSTPFSRGFDDYALSPSGSTLADQVASLPAAGERERSFVFINAGDTHYPYLLPPDSLPRVSGIHGALRGGLEPGGHAGGPDPSDAALMAALHDAQVAALEGADAALGALADRLPKPLLLVVCSDHGELFGEDGRFGHGPYFHPLLFDVPVAAGVVGAVA